MCSIGPRQITGWFSSTKNPIDMHRTPLASGGTIIWSITTGSRSTPSMRGMEKPHTSASTTATRRRAPSGPERAARATARLVVTELLPTPPLPEATRITRVRLSASAKGMARPSA